MDRRLGRLFNPTRRCGSEHRQLYTPTQRLSVVHLVRRSCSNHSGDVAESGQALHFWHLHDSTAAPAFLGALGGFRAKMAFTPGEAEDVARGGTIGIL